MYFFQIDLQMRKDANRRETHECLQYTNNLYIYYIKSFLFLKLSQYRPKSRLKELKHIIIGLDSMSLYPNNTHPDTRDKCTGLHEN